MSVYSVNPPLAVPTPATPAREVVEYAYYREVVGEERRPAKALGKWSDVWDRVDAALSPKP